LNGIRSANRDRPSRRRVALIASTTAVAAVTGAILAPQDGSASPGSAAANGGGTASGGGSSGRSAESTSLKLRSEDAAPDKVFVYGEHKGSFRYSIAGSEPRDLKIQAVRRRNWHVVRTWIRRRVEPGEQQVVRWSGTTDKGRPPRRGTYLFRVVTRHGAKAERERVRHGDRSFGLYPYKFPVRARHTYGDRYGAPRSGHVHQGQDVLAGCGRRVVAARGGRIQHRGYQASGAGYYLVVDGKGTAHDHVYMHLRRGGRPKAGARVRTGEPIGKVGQTGDASGCHLHFEIWTKPGWYEGGRPMRSVTRHLRSWDRWS
jgi:murein DD-endopeptidase MepM/ murein hydrolase activator NlpD